MGEMGLTLACGTELATSAVVANHLGFVENEVNVKVPGGGLIVRKRMEKTMMHL